MQLYFEKNTIYPHNNWQVYDQPINEVEPQTIAIIRPTTEHTFIKTINLVDLDIMRAVMAGAERIENKAKCTKYGKFELVVDFKDKGQCHPKERAANQAASNLTNFKHEG